MISYGAVPLVDTKSAERLFADKIPLRESFQFYRWRKLSSSQYDPSRTHNWFLEREVEPGRLFWPWGASRWGYGQFVIDQDMLDDLRLLVYAGGNYRALPLKFDDGLGSTLTTDLWMLSPIPLQKISLRNNLYLMTLVDDRYFWWERGAEIEVDEGTTTWAELYASIATALGIALSVDPISADYLMPSGTLTQRYEYLPMLLDHVAASVGQRIVRTIGGDYYARNATTAKSLVTTQYPLYRRFQGERVDVATDAPGNVPATVLVRFPRADSGTVGDEVFTVAVSLSGLGIFEYSGATPRNGKYLVHDTAIANFTGGANPANIVELTTLAQRIARDFYTWRLASLECRFEKAVPWIVDGMHDIEWDHRDTIATNVRRSEWEPEFGSLAHSGTYGAELTAEVGPQLRIVTGTKFTDGTFDANLLLIDPMTKVRTTSKAVWAIDLANSEALPAGADYLCHLQGLGKGGPPYIAVTSSAGESLTNTAFFVQLLSDPASVLPYVPSIVDAIDIANGEQVIVSGSSPTDFTSPVSLVIVDSDSSITAGLVVIIGTMEDGSIDSELIDIANGGTATYTTSLSFKTVATVFVLNLAGEAAGDTIQVIIQEYPVGVLRSDGGDTFLVTTATAGAPAAPDWTEVAIDDKGGYSEITAYTAGDYVKEVREVHAMRFSLRGLTSLDGSVTIDESTLDVPDLSAPSPITIINVTNIEEFNSFEENTFYFNTYDQTIYININNTWIQFCPCGVGSGSSGSGGGGGSGTVETDCCGNMLPETLYATVTGGCRNGTFPMAYNSGGGYWEYWEGDQSTCDSIGLVLTCAGGQWNLTTVATFCGPDGNDASWTNISATCDPFYLEVAGDASDGGGVANCGSITIVVTE